MEREAEGRCTALRRDGHPCTVKALPDGAGLCFAHSTRLKERRRSGNAAGGQAKSRTARAAKLMPATLRPVVAQLIAALDETHEGTLEPRQASAMASLAGAIGRLYEVAALEQRVEQLEAHHDQTG